VCVHHILCDFITFSDLMGIYIEKKKKKKKIINIMKMNEMNSNNVISFYYPYIYSFNFIINALKYL